MKDTYCIFPKHGVERDGVTFCVSPSSVIDEGKPRIQSEKTIDGGVVYESHGFNHGDRNFMIRAENLSHDDISRLRAIQANETEIYLSAREALFLVHLSSIDYKDGVGIISGMIRARYEIEYPDAFIPELATHGIWYDSDYYVDGDCGGDIAYRDYSEDEGWVSFHPQVSLQAGVYIPPLPDPTWYFYEYREYGFLKVLAVDIPKAAKISSAYLGFHGHGINDSAIYYKIYGCVSSSYPTTIFNAIAKTHTTSYAEWTEIVRQPGSETVPTDGGPFSNPYERGGGWEGTVISADISSVLQEIVDSSEYSPGDSVLFTIMPITEDEIDIYQDTYPFEFTQDRSLVSYFDGVTSKYTTTPTTFADWPFMSAHWDYVSGAATELSISPSDVGGIGVDYRDDIYISDGYYYETADGSVINEGALVSTSLRFGGYQEEDG